jgi:adenylate cyclase
LSVTLKSNEKTRLARTPTQNLEAYEAFLKAGRPFAYTDEALKKKLALFNKATELDPDFAEAYAADAALAAFLYRHQWWTVMRPSEARERAFAGVTRALALNPETPLAHSALGILQLVAGQHADAILAARKAVSLAPNDADARTTLAIILTYAGQPEAAITEMEAVLRLDPKPAPSVLIIDGFTNLIAGRYEDALERFEKAKAMIPDNMVVNAFLASTYARLSRMDEAKEAMQLVLKRQPYRAVSWVKLTYAYMKRSEDLDRWVEGEHMAGLPEWPMGFQGNESRRLTGEEIESIIFGKTIEGTEHQGGGGFPFKRVSFADGSVVKENKYGVFRGTSSVREDMWCVRSADVFFGREACAPVYRTPGGTPEDKNEYVTAWGHSVTYFSVVH